MASTKQALVASTKQALAERPFVCGRSDNVLSAIEKCLNNGIGTCFVTNEDDTLVGRVSLEDLRRGLLSPGQAAGNPSIEDYITAIAPLANIQPQQALVQSATLEAVLDSDGHLTDVRVDRSTQAIQVGKPTLNSRRISGSDGRLSVVVDFK